MNIRTIAAALATTLALTTGQTQAATTVQVGADGIFTVDGTAYNLISTKPDYSGLMWEGDSASGYKACLCSMLSYRALQAVGQYLGTADINTADTAIVTGWNTDGPEHIYVHSLGWELGSEFQYARPITAPSALTLADAWFTFTISGASYQVNSLAANYVYTANTSHAGYMEDWDFFDYRTAVQNGNATNDERLYFQTVIRNQIVTNFTNGGTFAVQPVPVPSTLLTLGSGLAALALVGRRGSFRTANRC